MQSIRSQFFIHAFLAVLTIQNPLYSEVASSHLPLPCISWNPTIATVFVCYSTVDTDCGAKTSISEGPHRTHMPYSKKIWDCIRYLLRFTAIYANERQRVGGFQLPSLSPSPAAIVAGCERGRRRERPFSEKNRRNTSSPLSAGLSRLLQSG